jgi:hypothetical protein
MDNVISGNFIQGGVNGIAYHMELHAFAGDDTIQLPKNGD